MRVLYLSNEYPLNSASGGIGSYVKCIAAELSSRGHDVHVLYCARGQESRDDRDGQVWVHRRGLVRLGLGRLLGTHAGARLANAMAFWLHARRLGLEFDVVEAPDWGASGLLFAITRRFPLVGHLHGPLRILARFSSDPPESRLADLLERICMNRADRLTAPSRLLIEELSRLGWIRAEEVSLIRLPVDLRNWEGLPSPAVTAARVMHLGRLETGKAPEILLDAIAGLSQKSSVEVVFLGRSGTLANGVDYSSWLQTRALELGVHCVFIPERPRESLPSLLATIRIAVITSRFDNFPMAGLEAMAAGRGLVCTETAGLAELVRSSNAGQVVPPNDATALGRALEPYIDSKALAGVVGRYARELVELNCSPTRIAEEREGLYSEAVRKWKNRSH